MPKKRSPGEGGLHYDKAKNLWRGRYDNGFWPDGRRRQGEVSARTQVEARRKLKQKLSEIAEHGTTLDRSVTVAAWSQHWLETVCRMSYTPNGLATAESVVRNWIIPQLGTRRVAELKPSDVRLVHKAVIDAGRSTATARKAHDILSGMLRSARLDGVAARNVADDVVPPAVIAKERGSLSTEETLAALAAAANLEGTRWWVTLLVGLRQGERLGARLESLDLDAGLLKIEWALEELRFEHGCGEQVGGRWPCLMKRAGSCPQRRFKVKPSLEFIPLHGRLALIRPKSGKVRTAPLIAPVVVALRRYVEATKNRPNPYGLIWRHEDGSPYLPGEDEQLWRDLLHTAGIITAEQTKPPKDRAAGTPDIPTSHWARHTTATVLMELGVDAKIVGEIVGHVDPKTTRRYQHVSSPAAREAIGRIGTHWATALEFPAAMPELVGARDDVDDAQPEPGADRI